MLGKAHGIEADVLGHPRDFNHLIEHALPALGTVRYRAQRAALLHRCRQCWQEKVHELHRALRYASGCLRHDKAFTLWKAIGVTSRSWVLSKARAIRINSIGRPRKTGIAFLELVRQPHDARFGARGPSPRAARSG